MAYREQLLCAYCDGVEIMRCTRCRCRLCETHRAPAGDGWCWACTKEIRDEFDLVEFKALIGAPMQGSPRSQQPNEAWMRLGRWVAQIRKRRMHRKLVERSREEIEAWRRSAGIDTRW